MSGTHDPKVPQAPDEGLRSITMGRSPPEGSIMFASGAILPATTVLFAAAVMALALLQRLIVRGPGLHLFRSDDEQSDPSKTTCECRC